jgi:predicted HTH transcriptional regulator
LTQHLVELEIVKYSEHGVSPANGGVRLAIGNLSETISDKFPINGSDKLQIMLEYMANHDFVTTAELAELIDMSQRSVLNMLKEPIEKGVVVRSGGRRDAKYALSK